jgi:hypothetical protein
MNCTNARLLLNFVRAGEMDPAEREVLDHHLTACSECAVFAESENRFDEAMAMAMARVPVPAGLKGRLLGQLARPRRWSWVAAAALLLAVGLTCFAALTRGPEELDASRWSVKADIKRTPEAVEGWFSSELATPMTAPRDFNFSLLSNIDVAVIQGRQVPKLTFFGNRGALAHVYVLSTRQFKLPAEHEEEVALKDSWHGEISIPCATKDIKIRRYPGVPGFFYVVIYTGGTLDPFLLQGI